MSKNPYNELPFIRFKGKFRDLIPQGWLFQKYSCYSNGRCYNKPVLLDRGLMCPTIRVWQKYGGYVEFDDFLHESYLFAQFLMNEENVKSVKWEYDKELVPGWGKECKSRTFYINTLHGYLVYPTNHREQPDNYLYSVNEVDDETREKMRNDYYREWRSVIVLKEMFYACLDMVNSGMIEIVIP